MGVYGNGLVHSDFCLTINRRKLILFAGTFQLPWKYRRIADRVEVTCRASKSDNKRLRAIERRASVVIENEMVGDGNVVIGNERVGDGKSNGALEMLYLLDMYPELDGSKHL